MAFDADAAARYLQLHNDPDPATQTALQRFREDGRQTDEWTERHSIRVAVPVWLNPEQRGELGRLLASQVERWAAKQRRAA